MERRQFLRLICGGAAITYTACATGSLWALLLEPLWLSLERVRISPKTLPSHLRGLRIAFFSDLHCGPPR